MARTPDPEPGQRIRVTKSDDDTLIGVGAVIVEVHDHALIVEWDYATLNARGVALLRGADRWEVTTDAPPPHP